MISTACPYCKILVVEANSPSVSDLARSDDTAARLGAQVISNSYGIRESGYSQTFARAYRHPGQWWSPRPGTSASTPPTSRPTWPR